MSTLRKRILNCFIASALAMTCCAVHASAAETKLPILMYHDLSTESSAVNSMTITADRFRQDMEFLREYGFTPLLSADLINIKSGAKPMPQNPVMITFDDGYVSNYTLAYPLIRDNGMKATIALITSHIREPSLGGGYESSLDWGQVKEMYDSGVVDFGSHTYALHNEETRGQLKHNGVNGVQRERGETYSAYQARVMFDLSYSIRQLKSHLGDEMHVWYFSYPFGATDAWFGQALLDNAVYVSTTTQMRTANIANGLYGLPRYRITMDKPVSELLQRTVTAQPTLTKVSLDGHLTNLPTYQIAGSNYVKLRDVAALLDGTPKEFSVDWSGGDITLHPGQEYHRDGSEFMALGAAPGRGKSMTGQVKIGDESMMLAAYNIGNNNYFKLRSLGEKLDFSVAYDENNQVIILKTTA